MVSHNGANTDKELECLRLSELFAATRRVALLYCAPAAKSAIFDWLVERVSQSGGAVHGVRVRADGPVPRHTGGRGGAQRGRRERLARPARQTQDGHGIRGEEGKVTSPHDLVVRHGRGSIFVTQPTHHSVNPTQLITHSHSNDHDPTQSNATRIFYERVT